MNFSNGVEIAVGDQLRLPNGECAAVVASIDTKTYSPEYSENEWGYLTEGILVRTVNGALIHLDKSASITQIKPQVT